MRESRTALVCKQTHFKAKLGLNQKSWNDNLEAAAISHRAGIKSKDASNGDAHPWPATGNGLTGRGGNSKDMRTEQMKRQRRDTSPELHSEELPPQPHP